MLIVTIGKNILKFIKLNLNINVMSEQLKVKMGKKEKMLTKMQNTLFKLKLLLRFV